MTDVPAPRSAVRPRLLAPLGLVAFLYAVIGLVIAWSTIAALSGSHDLFLSAVRKDPARMLGLASDIGTAADQLRVAERKAETLWSRRQVLLPLAGANSIASVLVLLGVVRVLSRRGRRAAWGRSAWQLGLIVWLPCLALESVVGWLHARELLAALADLHDPISERLREGIAMRDQIVLVQAILSALYLSATAAYLGTAKVTRYCADADSATA